MGFALWGISLALGGGVVPFGETGAAESALFFTPVVVFAAPLAVLAFVRGHALTGIWTLAVAPVFGFLNFALAASAKMAEPDSLAAKLSAPATQLLVWILFLALALVALALFNRLHSQQA